MAAINDTVENFDGEAVQDTASQDVFQQYVCRSSAAAFGKPHPGDIAEATSLSSVQLPSTTYPLLDALPREVVEAGTLSQLQIEGALYATSKHQTLLPNGYRAGFFIGDGAGVGKGRQIAAVILDNYVRGRRKHVWLSISSDLRLDAQRDFRDLGSHINIINNVQTLDKETRALGLSTDFQTGVLFMTYSTLISSTGNKARLQQVIDWLGGESFDGCLVFDECHKAKNFVAGKEGASTKVSQAVLALQDKLPNARVLYCSATGVSEVGHMAYMGSRMGLWGVGTAFKDFEAFLDTMKRRGVSFLEMLAMEMKGEGKYVARGLSFKETEFTELTAVLTSDQVATYNAAVDVWLKLRAALTSALSLTLKPAKDVMKIYWSTQQRFFKLLCVSLKVPTVVSEALSALQAGHCVVIGLQTTGEAADTSVGLEPGPVQGFVSTTKEMLVRFVKDHFPVRRVEPQAEGAPHEVGPNNEGIIIAECVAARDMLLQSIQDLDLPANFLDSIIDQLGGVNQVAEMTGRRGRIVRQTNTKGGTSFAYELRAKPDTGDMESLNIREKELFMNGKRLVAIISDAASTGISLHASRSAINQRRRVHLTIELPWSADKAIQQLGRSHRSNQVTGPVYKLISTSIGGEKRFAAAVARRLQSLGALTRGDRRAASGIDLSEQNFDSPLGRRSLRRMYDQIVLESPQLPPGVSLTAILKENIKQQAGMQDLQDSEAEALAEIQDPVMRAAAVTTLHQQLREYVDVMGIGVGSGRNTHDTAAEDTALAGPAGGLGTAKADGKDKPNAGNKEVGDVRRFLNRLLGLPVAQQAVLFAYFAATLDAEVEAAKRDGKWSEGLADLPSSTLTSCGPAQVMWEDPLSGLRTMRNDFTTDRGMSYQAALYKLQHEAGGEQSLADCGGLPETGSGFWRSKRPQYGSHLVLLALQRPGSRLHFTVYRPNTGQAFLDMEKSELDQRYVRVTPAAVAQEWEAAYTAALKHCMHGSGCKQGAACRVGRRLQPVTVLSGSVVRVWGVLESVLARHEFELSHAERIMRVVRVALPKQNSGSAPNTPRKANTIQLDNDEESELEIVDDNEDISFTTQATTKAPQHNNNGGSNPSTPRAANATLGSPRVLGTSSAQEQYIVGVRYPAFLLPEVVTALQSSLQFGQSAAHGTGLPGGYVPSAGLGILEQAPTPVDKRWKVKAFTEPKTIKDFFSKAKPAPIASHAAVASQQLSATQQQIMMQAEDDNDFCMMAGMDGDHDGNIHDIDMAEEAVEDGQAKAVILDMPDVATQPEIPATAAHGNALATPTTAPRAVGNQQGNANQSTTGTLAVGSQAGKASHPHVTFPSNIKSQKRKAGMVSAPVHSKQTINKWFKSSSNTPKSSQPTGNGSLTKGMVNISKLSGLSTKQAVASTANERGSTGSSVAKPDPHEVMMLDDDDENENENGNTDMPVVDRQLPTRQAGSPIGITLPDNVVTLQSTDTSRQKVTNQSDGFVQELVSMGFREGIAHGALKQARGNLQQAIEICLSKQS